MSSDRFQIVIMRDGSTHNREVSFPSVVVAERWLSASGYRHMWAFAWANEDRQVKAIIRRAWVGDDLASLGNPWVRPVSLVKS